MTENKKQYTYDDLITALPEQAPSLERIRKNREARFQKSSDISLSELLLGSFSWVDTKEGAQYWCKALRQLKEKGKP